jgi:hypothetical protein
LFIYLRRSTLHELTLFLSVFLSLFRFRRSFSFVALFSFFFCFFVPLFPYLTDEYRIMCFNRGFKECNKLDMEMN